MSLKAARLMGGLAQALDLKPSWRIFVPFLEVMAANMMCKALE